eukprot:CAMPEP_0180659526 /NCGR_PEP_ID=MMETSP1037_2-20121125/57637_1 /TAXON_ID=632150 /ORGANISM="Azadinium spinosum, Strain 3D9" /LENGTH=91 /DNA_ID=CAMNT_0022686591 /DNA_START=334 /DNA_END=606 /DNA_ORIENTATION=+
MWYLGPRNVPRGHLQLAAAVGIEDQVTVVCAPPTHKLSHFQLSQVVKVTAILLLATVSTVFVVAALAPPLLLRGGHSAACALVEGVGGAAR